MAVQTARLVIHNMYLLDTNILSELVKRKPDSRVVHFIQQAKHNNDALFLSVITIGEITKGIVKLNSHGDQSQAEKLQHWLNDVKTEFADNLLDIDADATALWGTILAKTDDTNAIDKLIAATALLYDLTVVTRNLNHIQPTGAKCVNPFSA